jgi:hypothetical protein
MQHKKCKKNMHKHAKDASWLKTTDKIGGAFAKRGIFPAVFFASGHIFLLAPSAPEPKLQ